jgi:hypothetical protein
VADGLRSWTGFAAAGGAAALAAAFELPALAWLAAVLGLLATCDLRRTLSAALPAALVVAAAALSANWLAHGSIAPAYAHRTTSPRSQQSGTAAVPVTPPPGVVFREGESWNPDNWYDYRLRLSNGKLLTSYWNAPQGVDRGEPSATRYAWHALVGHHGIFSLTPAWLLVIPGLAFMAANGRRWTGDGTCDRAGLQATAQQRLARAIATVSVVVVIFYLTRPQLDRNYGGTSSGFRWVFWLAPLWVMAVVPAADRLGLTMGRAGPALYRARIPLRVLVVVLAALIVAMVQPMNVGSVIWASIIGALVLFILEILIRKPDEVPATKTAPTTKPVAPAKKSPATKRATAPRK